MCNTTNRHLRVRLETDGPEFVFAGAEFDAVTTVTVGRVDGSAARVYDDPSVRLTVRPDGSWTVDVAGPGWGNRPTVVAEGHVDQIGVSP